MSTRFPDSEFQDASQRTLTARELEHAQSFRVLWLDAARAALNFPIKLTSFVRIGSGTHNGNSLDVQPCRICGGVRISEDVFQRRLEALHQWIGINRPRAFGVLIHERNHLHVTLPGFQSRTGVVLREPREGVYIPESLRPILSVAPLVAAALILFILLHRV